MGESHQETQDPSQEREKGSYIQWSPEENKTLNEKKVHIFNGVLKKIKRMIYECVLLFIYFVLL